MKSLNKNESGYAILVTVIITSLVLSITLYYINFHSLNNRKLYSSENYKKSLYLSDSGANLAYRELEYRIEVFNENYLNSLNDKWKEIIIEDIDEDYIYKLFKDFKNDLNYRNALILELNRYNNRKLENIISEYDEYNCLEYNYIFLGESINICINSKYNKNKNFIIKEVSYPEINLNLSDDLELLIEFEEIEIKSFYRPRT